MGGDRPNEGAFAEPTFKLHERRRVAIVDLLHFCPFPYRFEINLRSLVAHFNSPQ